MGRSRPMPDSTTMEQLLADIIMSAVNETTEKKSYEEIRDIIANIIKENKHLIN